MQASEGLNLEDASGDMLMCLFSPGSCAFTAMNNVFVDCVF